MITGNFALKLEKGFNPPFGLAWGGKDAGDGVEKAVRDEAKKGFRGRFGAGLPATGDMQLLFMQHAIAKMTRGQGRAAIITNGSPLFSGNTTSGESQIRHYMLRNDFIEAIIALPSQLFYNTDIGIYAFILSKNKRKERRNKIQLINATDMWEPLKRSLGKKRREISKEQIDLITEVYAAFAIGSKTLYSEKRKGECRIGSRIFEREEFMYREWAVYQPLQRRGSIDAPTIEKLKHSDYFTANSNLYNEVEFAELSETNPRDPKAERKYQKYVRGKSFIDAVIEELEAHQSEEVYMDFAQFYAKVKGFKDRGKAGSKNGEAKRLCPHRLCQKPSIGMHPRFLIQISGHPQCGWLFHVYAPGRQKI